MTKNQTTKPSTAMTTLTVITASSAVWPCVSSPRAARSSRCLRFSQPSIGTTATILTTTPTSITAMARPTESRRPLHLRADVEPAERHADPEHEAGPQHHHQQQNAARPRSQEVAHGRLPEAEPPERRLNSSRMA